MEIVFSCPKTCKACITVESWHNKRVLPADVFETYRIFERSVPSSGETGSAEFSHSGEIDIPIPEVKTRSWYFGEIGKIGMTDERIEGSYVLNIWSIMGKYELVFLFKTGPPNVD